MEHDAHQPFAARGQQQRTDAAADRGPLDPAATPAPSGLRSAVHAPTVRRPTDSAAGRRTDPVVSGWSYGGCMRPVSKIERTVAPFEVVSPYQPSGDQPTAIADLEKRIRAGEKDVVLLGATGTGKSATTAWMIEKLQRPTLVMAPNKTLAAQLANEFRELLPTTPSSTSSRTTTTTSPRRTYRSPIRTSRRTPRSTRRSSASATPRRTRC